MEYVTTFHRTKPYLFICTFIYLFTYYLIALFIAQMYRVELQDDKLLINLKGRGRT